MHTKFESTVSRKYIVEELLKQGITPRSGAYVSQLEDFLLEHWKLEKANCSKEALGDIIEIAQKLSYRVKKYYEADQRKSERMFANKRHKDFFSALISCPDSLENERLEQHKRRENVGRPPKPFEEKGRTAKHNEVAAVEAAMPSTASPGAMVLAAQKSYKKKGHKDAAFVLRKLADDPNEQGSKFRSAANVKGKFFLD